MFYSVAMGTRPPRTPWPPEGEPRAPSAPRRIRHVWVRGAFGGAASRQGLVVTWRRVVRDASPPAWQALVVVVDDRFELVSAEWFFSYELRPVRSEPPV